MTDPLRAETERLLALAVDPPDGRWLCERMATHLHAIQAEADRMTAECEALRVDAERYRLARSNELSGKEYDVVICRTRWRALDGLWAFVPLIGERADDAIDALNPERK